MRGIEAAEVDFLGRRMVQIDGSKTVGVEGLLVFVSVGSLVSRMVTGNGRC
jgi:hypothetical protein